MTFRSGALVLGLVGTVAITGALWALWPDELPPAPGLDPSGRVVSVDPVSASPPAVLPRRVVDAGRAVPAAATEDLGLVVEVFDAHGEPAAGVPLAIHQEVRPGVRLSGIWLWKGDTNASGRVRVPRAELTWCHEEGTHRFACVVRSPTRRPVSVEFRDDPWPEVPLRLDLPESVDLEIRIEARSGGAVEVPASVRVEPGYIRGTLFDRSWSGSDYYRFFDDLLPGGPAVFRGVEVGAKIRVEARFHDYPTDVGYECVATVPASDSGRVARLALPLGDDLLIVTGALVGGTSAHALLELRAEYYGEDVFGSQCAPVPIRPDGRFAVVMHRPDEGLVTSLRVGGRDAAGRLHDARVRLPALPPGDRLEIGVMSLSPVPELTRGRIVDLRGAPIAGAQVTVESDDHREDELAETETDDHGAFVVYAHPPQEDLRLWIEARGYRPTNAPAVADQVVVLHPSTDDPPGSKR